VITGTAERLENFYHFDEGVIADVAEVAHWQNDLSFWQLADKYGLADGLSRGVDPVTGRPFEYLRLTPQEDYDDTHARVLHAPMATPINPSLAVRAIRLFGADPKQQLVVVGNPGPVGSNAGTLGRQEIRQVWNGDLSPTVMPTIRLLGDLGIKSVDHLGYSCGADKAVVASALSSEYGLTTKQQVLMEMASTRERGLLGMLKAFRSCRAPLAEYIKNTGSKPLYEARRLADVGKLRYAGGLLRLSNVAIAKVLSQDGFSARLQESISANPDMRSTVIWGGCSELADNTYLTELMDGLKLGYGSDVIRSFVVERMLHAGGDDVDLHAAMVLQALRAT